MEGVGASKIGSIYMLIAVIGRRMDMQIFDNQFHIILGLIWIFIHVIVLFIMAKLIKAPQFFIAVASQANIGGAASAPVVAGAFNPNLKPVVALLAI